MAGFLRYSAVALLVCLLCGCNPVTRHEVLSTIFDGVPSLPPPEEFCQDYANQAVARLRAEMEGKGKASETAAQGSAHKPYVEKHCDRCHDKTSDSGFVSKTKNELCFVCHTGFLKGAYVHGPAAVGECLACHDPHSSTNRSLLKVSEADICATCHREARQAASLHRQVVTRGMICINCHDPHSGNVRFFLK